MERICLTTGAMSFQPWGPTLMGTTTSSALPSVAGTGPMIWPLTWLRPAKRLASAVALAWSAAVTSPARSYTSTAGKTSLGVNLLASSTTWVDSAFFGSQEDASFFSALLSLLESGQVNPSTAIQKARTNHLAQRPDGKAAIFRARSITPQLPLRPADHTCPTTSTSGPRLWSSHIRG